MLRLLGLVVVATALLDGHCLGNSLGTSVGLVNLGVLGESGSLEIRTVKVVNSLLDDNGFRSTKVLADIGSANGLVGLGMALAGRLDDKFGSVLAGADNIGGFGVGNSAELEQVEALEVSLFDGKLNGTGSLGVAILFLQKGIVALGELPD